MKNPTRILAALTMIAALAIPYGCKDDDDPAAPLELSTITVGGADLNGSASPVGVAKDANINVKFTTAVDPATTSNIKLTRDYDDVDIPVTVTLDPNDASMITIDPNDDLQAGNLYKLTLGTGLMSDRGEAFAEQSRTFTTAGFFSLPGQAAHWSFESNGDDEFGAFNSTVETDIVYTDGRNAGSGKAAQFNGSTSIMEVPNGDQFLNGNDFALSFWVKPDASNTHGHFVLGVAGAHGFQYEIPMDMSSVKIATQYATGDPTADTSEDTWWNGENSTKDNGGWQGWTFAKDVGGADGVKAIFTDKWAHVVCTYVAATKVGTMYVNGEKVKEFDFNLYPDDNPRKNATGVKYLDVTDAPGNNLAFGFLQTSSKENRSITFDYGDYDSETTNHFKGLLDDVRIWKKAISASEVTLIYQSEK